MPALYIRLGNSEFPLSYRNVVCVSRAFSPFPAKMIVIMGRPVQLDTILYFCPFAALFLYVVQRKIRGSSRIPYPPGPKADPIIGHARVMPLEYQWYTFADWGKKFGDVLYVHVFNKAMIILNSTESARELLEKRGANYSDRPRLVLLQELMGWDTILAFLRYGDRFRKHRKLMQQHWNQQATMFYRPMQRVEIHTLLDNLVKNPQNYGEHVKRAVAASVVMAAYGHKVTSNDDPYIHLVEKASRMTAASGSPGATPVDFVPALRHIPSWMPGAGFKRYAMITRKAVREMLDQPYELVKKRMAAGTARPSFIQNLLDEYQREKIVDLEHEEDIKAVGGVLYGAGVDTTVATLMTFILFMVLQPDIAKKAQAEIDTAIGRDRLPDFEDRDSIPYINCILKEILRWNPPVPLGLPHASMNPDVYKGQQIPGGAMIIPNLWAMMRDESVYKNPHDFNPDRFVGRTAENDDYDPITWVFGFGRRVCPGRFFADAGLWLSMACILAAFEILPAVDKDGKEIMPSKEFTTGSSSQPKPFQCRFVLRDSRYTALIEECARMAD